MVVSGKFTEAALSHVAARVAGLSGTIPAKIPKSANVEFFTRPILQALSTGEQGLDRD